MALSPAETQRLYRERKKEKERTQVDAAAPYLKTPFHEFLNAHPDWTGVAAHLDFAGITPPTFDADDDQAWEEHYRPYADDTTTIPYRGAIGRAERMVGLLLEAADDLARIVIDYKRQELEREVQRLNEIIENSSAQERKKAVAEIVKIDRILSQLGKETRLIFRQWKVKGV